MKMREILTERSEFGQINEAGLSRLLSKASGNDFCILTGFRYGKSLKQNRELNKQILSGLASSKMSGYMLIGHWQEAPDGVEYQDANSEDLTDSVEESVLFIKRPEISTDDFINLCVGLGKKYNQDAVIVGLKDQGVFLYFKSGERQQIGSKIALGKIGQAYSQMRKKKNVPFVFEGNLQPTGNIGKQAFKSLNISYIRD